MPKPWSYDTKAKRYRSGDSGRFMPKAQVVALRDAVIEASAREAESLARRVAAGEITPAAFREGMRTAIRNSYGANAIFGRGGVNAMTPADFGRLGATLRRQYGFLDRFVLELEAGRVSTAQAANRAKMYVDGGAKAFEQGRAAAWGIDGQLPLYPGDNCDGNDRCRCSWVLVRKEDVIEATWTLGGADPCGPCQANAARYNPYTIPARWAQPATEPVRLRDLVRSVA
jgi:hypothetical protein